MRILGKECIKILDVRLLLILGVFTFLYYQLFPNVMLYPAGGQCTDSPYDMPFVAELIEEFGTTITDWSVLEGKREELKEAWGKSVEGNTILESAGITTYDELIEKEGKYLNKEECTLKEEEIYEEILRINLEDEETSKLYFEIQHLNRFLDTKKPVDFSLQDSAISLLPEGAVWILAEDMKYIVILTVICFFVLVIPNLIRERLRKVLPLYVTTKTGRNLYKIQFTACLVSCGVVGLLQLFVYLVVFIEKGLSAFWRCPIWSGNLNGVEVTISYGTFMLFYMVAVWLFVMGSLVFAYWIGRVAGNYVSGIALAIPVGGVICFIAVKIFSALLFGFWDNCVRLWEVAGLLLWTLFAVIVIMVRLKREKKQDILI